MPLLGVWLENVELTPVEDLVNWRSFGESHTLVFMGQLARLFKIYYARNLAVKLMIIQEKIKELNRIFGERGAK